MRSLIRSSVIGGIALVLSALATGLPAQQWYQSPVNGHVYTLSPEMTWHQAEDYAIGFGGHLATVRNQAEQDWLFMKFGTQELWIGLNDEAVEGSFVWSSGEPVAFTNWATGEPTGPADADFALSDGNGWNDFPADLLTRGIIEVTDLASYLPFGSGCAGSVGIPVLAAAADSLPRISHTFTVEISNLPAGSAGAFVIFGSSRTDFAGVPLRWYPRPQCGS